jgi:hypothetical protein
MMGLPLLLLVFTTTQTAEGWTLQRPNHSSDLPTESLSEYLSEPNSTPRRDLLLSPFLVASISWGFTVPTGAAIAAAPQDAGEAIRRAAANIPGYGQTDVFFPTSLTGTWTMNRQVEFGTGRDPLRLSYPFRFIQSIEDDAVVADRGFNQAELEQAILQTVMGNTTRVRSYEWVQTNPNDLRLVLADGKRKEIKVTKRATERTENTVSSSEFQRITQEDQGGIPYISARRVITKWKVVDDNTLEGLEVIYDLGGGDPMAMSVATGANPTLLSKSRMVLKR